MKQCPTCGNTYTNDQLVFCLEDGAKLLSVRNAQTSFDQEKTLRISGEDIPRVDAFKPQGAHTNVQAPPPLTTPPRHAPPTLETPAPADVPASGRRPTSPFLIAGVTAIVLLLVVIAAIGAALLLRDSSQNGNAIPANGNQVANNDSTRNATNNENTRAGNSNKADGDEANRNGAQGLSAMERAEAKVVRGTPVSETDLAKLTGEQLRRLRNTVYARHGRTFDSPELQSYFDSRPWYKPRYDYNDTELTETDRANIKLIQASENAAY
jgi:hypothetical protein